MKNIGKKGEGGGDALKFTDNWVHFLLAIVFLAIFLFVFYQTTQNYPSFGP